MTIMRIVAFCFIFIYQCIADSSEKESVFSDVKDGMYFGVNLTPDHNLRIDSKLQLAFFTVKENRKRMVRRYFQWLINLGMHSLPATK